MISNEYQVAAYISCSIHNVCPIENQKSEVSRFLQSPASTMQWNKAISIHERISLWTIKGQYI